MNCQGTQEGPDTPEAGKDGGRGKRLGAGARRGWRRTGDLEILPSAQQGGRELEMPLPFATDSRAGRGKQGPRRGWLG